MNNNGKSKKQQKQVQVRMNPDSTPILFTDSISMTTNPDGVVLDVMQRLGPTSQVSIVTRVGMSRQHAKKFVGKLGELLLKTDGAVVTGKKIVN